MKKNTNRRAIVSFIICILALAIIFGLLYKWRDARMGNPVQEETPPIPVSAIKAKSQSVSNYLQAVGSLQAVREVLLAPDTSGRVTAINFKAGQAVKKGEVLVKLFDAPEQADRAAAKAKADFALVQLKRSQNLSTSGAESREILEQRKAEAAQAQAAVKQLDARIQQKTIRAPFSGQIGIRQVNLGQYLNAGDSIATLTQHDPLYVNFTLPQQDIAQLSIDAPVKVSVDAIPEHSFTAKVSTVEPRINRETRNVAVQALLPNGNHQLKSGMYVTANLELPATANAVILPLTAILTSASGDHVVLVQNLNANNIGTAVSIPVTTGRRIGNDIIITQGVKRNDVVVTAGQNRLPPQATVRISTDAAASTVLSDL
ncbi:efflux RND transporter periplasmic adaptor subunit [Pseudoalteromonas sp. NCIMB_1079]|uniref:efflux RND transporter periplasmic adaptor subunit n=1 Tax=Pseudoalteromonas sp. NCIMB 1079 TaxID=3142847 RepID=UPI00339C69C8